MWLIKAVGAIHGQSYFTFALEQKKTYKVGRDKDCDIRFESKKVRPIEGTIEAKSWDLAHAQKPPELKWYSSPKKSGGFGKFKILLPMDEESVGSRDREDYGEGQESDQPGCYLHDHMGTGIELSDDAWFCAVWIDINIQHPKFKDESEETQSAMRRHCLAHTLAFDPSNKPTFVLSQTYCATPHCNYAVCYGIRILLPIYLEALLAKCNACWKKVADSQDSFALPPEEDPRFQPPLDPNLPNVRASVECWLPDPGRSALFEGWSIMGLRAERPPTEKRWLTAMGAKYTDIDIVSHPVSSGQDVIDRLKSWSEEIDASVGRSKALIVWFGNLKAELEKKGVKFSSMIGEASQKLGIFVVSGVICWAAVKCGGVEEYLEAFGGPRPEHFPRNDPIVTTREPSPASISAIREASPEPLAQPATASPSRSYPPARHKHVEVIPSTYPEELETVAFKTAQAGRPLLEDVDTSVSALSQPAKKPLKRRAGRVADPFPAPIIEESVQPTQSQLHISRDSQSFNPPASSQPSILAPETVLESRTQGKASISSGTTRLKRRVGTRPALSFDLPTETVESVARQIEDEETAAEIRELYEQTKAESVQPRPVKRARLASVESHISNSRESSAEPSIRPQLSHVNKVVPSIAEEPESEEIEEIEDDFIQRTLRKAAEAKKSGRSQASGPSIKSITSGRKDTSRIKEPESAEPLEPKKPAGLPVNQPKDSQIAKDPAFLSAISDATKTKKAVDELDMEFNQLRIPKRGGEPGSTIVKTNVWNADHPDWNIVNDFDDDMRGNFIQIIKTDLFRKDQKRVPEVVDDGRPNFKKFKKKNIVRRDPLPLILAGPTLEDAEMGDPYWPTQRANGKGRKATQVHDSDEEEDMPLLPSTRRAVLVDNDDDDMPPPSRTQRGRKKDQSTVPDTQQGTVTQSSRKTRAGSILSEASTTDTRSTATAKTRKPPARAAPTRGLAKRQPIVLEDSDDDGPSTLRSNSRSRNGMNGTDTNEADAQLWTAPRSRSTRSSGPTTATLGRRKLLVVDDDDDELVFRGLKKRRAK
ncbi:hypothetical protein TREMEDRAFT_59407 [Tremella mesenterica DSM 1558]|uniref:uncharacterized protein n=1 Tax=Tremella mesenterica (strain ATCC 24925 / CBS 8224 / DSM 1558 / NBRC 9311 / NRRL Y-6157 / RJB 2259-6 / UBC 559-6) TaxID=578456 RepID=UPI0003F4A4F9|nr:uncharacterized protein TREMEDRAFT_59407 [Tremella mesenterica DSM 1558]EIW73239.1 hypothetical protein TREMEDRAFT_59407 [Tremella mesenterica DSM 1558]